MNHGERVKKFQYNIGFLFGVTVAVSLVMIIAALFHWPLLVLCALAVSFYFVFKEESIMEKWIKRVFGIKIINMKLEALAKYVGIEFKHIPEHYSCIENGQQAKLKGG